MKFSKCILGFLLLLLTTSLVACSGSNSSDATKVSGQPKTTFSLSGSTINLTGSPDNQINPQVVYLADKKLYFSIWEDYRNRNTSGADIYGQFIQPDGILCSGAFAISTNPGDQTLPQVAYRQDKADSSSSKLVVTWQDSDGTATSGYVKYVSIPATAFPVFDSNTNSCSGSAPVVNPIDLKSVGFTNVKDYQVSAPTVKKEIVFNTYSTYNTSFRRSFTTTRRPLVPGPNAVKLRSLNSNKLDDIDTSSAFALSLSDDGNGGMSPTNGNTGYYTGGNINYNSGVIDFYNYVPSGTGKTTKYYQIDYGVYSTTAASRNEKLLSRKSPKIVYDASRDEFWLGWIESRDINNLFSTTCWGVPFTWQVGDPTFAGYLRLKGSDPNIIVPNGLGITQADLFRNHETSTARLISSSADATTITLTYEYFAAINNVAIASDSSSPETLFAWEGIRQKGVLGCTLDNATGIISSSFTSTNYDDGRVHVYGLFDKEILLPSTNAKFIDNDNTSGKKCVDPVSGPCTGTNPSIAFDAASNPHKFLVAWEDNRGGANTKIYGQLLYSGGSFYNSDILISYSNYNNTAVQDPTVTNSRQTKPTVTFDSVNQRYFVAWQDGRNSTTSSTNVDIYGQHIDLEGSLRGGNYSIISNIANQLAPVIAYDNLSKKFFTVWKGSESSSSNSDIYGQLYTLGQPQLSVLQLDNTPLTPAILDFGTSPFGVPAYKSFKVRNTGDSALNISSVTPPGTSSPFSVTPIGSSKLPPGAEQTFTVTYTPVEGSSSASLTINSDATIVTVDMSGLGVRSTLTPSTTTLSFGTLDVGQSQPQSVTLTNSGTIPVDITSISGISTTGAFQQDLINHPLPISQTLAAGNSIELWVLFVPNDIGDFNGLLSIKTKGSAADQSIILAGSGQQPRLLTDTTVLDFASVSLNTGFQKSVTIQNTGNKIMTINSLSIKGSSVFSIVSPVMLSGKPLIFNKGERAVIIINFTPTDRIAYTGTLEIVSDGGNASVAVTGQGMAGVLTPSPAQLDFGTAAINQSISKSVTLTNTGNAPLTITSITTPQNSQFSLSYNGTTPIKLIKDGSLTVKVTFSSSLVGFTTSSFQVKSDASNGTQTIDLQAATSSLAITTTNLSAGNLTLPYSQQLVATGGVQPFSWTIVTPNGGALPVGLTLDLNTGIISGTPTTTGNYVFVVQVADRNNLSTTQTLSINVNGAGTGPGTLVLYQDSANANISPPYSFGQVFKGTSVTKHIRAYNNDTKPITFDGAAVYKASSTTKETAYTTTVPTIQTTVAAGAYLDFDVTFTPTASAPYPANMVLTDTSGGQYPLALTGIGAAINVTINTNIEKTAYIYNSALGSASQLPTATKPANFTASRVINFEIRGVSSGGSIPVSVTFDYLPANPVFYKVSNNVWTLFTPDSIDLNTKTIAYKVTDSTSVGDAASTTDSDPTPGTIKDPVVVGTVSTQSTETVTATPPASSGGGGGGGGCFIATAAYGSYLDPHVMVLRNFRDDVLLQSELGTVFVKFYYKHSPPIADFIAEHGTLRLMMRFALTPLIFTVKYPAVLLGIILIGVLIRVRRIKVQKRIPVESEM
jgi:hypothetical protein